MNLQLLRLTILSETNKFKQMRERIREAKNSKQTTQDTSFQKGKVLTRTTYQTRVSQQSSLFRNNTAQLHNFTLTSQEEKRLTRSFNPLARYLRVLYFRRLKRAFTNIRKFASVSQSDSSMQMPIINIIPASNILQHYTFQSNYLEESIESLQAAIKSHIQKQKVYAFIKMKLIWEEKVKQQQRNQNTVHLMNIVDTALSNFRNRLTQLFFLEIKKYADIVEANIRDNSKSMDYTRKTSKSATILSTAQKQPSKQIIYIVHSGKSTQITNHEYKNKRFAYIKVPLIAESVEVNEINLQGQYTTQKTQRKNSFLSTGYKRSKKILSYNSKVLRFDEHSSSCRNCQFCKQQESLELIERLSAQKKRITSKEYFGLSRTKKMVRI